MLPALFVGVKLWSAGRKKGEDFTVAAATQNAVFFLGRNLPMKRALFAEATLWKRKEKRFVGVKPALAQRARKKETLSED